jgi:TPR repeat protein
VSANIPRSAGFGRDANRKSPGMVDYAWTAIHGSRHQRREALKLIRRAAAAGNPDAMSALADLEGGNHG